MSDDKTVKRDTKAASAGAKAAKADRDVGQALRSVYSHAVNEEVPAELLDLLGKLD